MRYFLFVALFAICLVMPTLAAAAPTLTITETRQGTWSFVGIDAPQVILQIESSCEAVPMRFEWTAMSDGPISTIEAYRYGWDVEDLNDDTQWYTDWCNVRYSEQTCYYGTHRLYVDAKDNTGVITRGTIVINITLVTNPSLTISEFYRREEWIFVGSDGPPVTLTETATDRTPPWVFEWWAFPCDPNAGTFTYRYGWDIADPNDDSQWSPWGDLHNAEPVEFQSGSHSFRVEVKDDTEAITRGTILINISGPSPVKSVTWSRIKAMYSE